MVLLQVTLPRGLLQGLPTKQHYRRSLLTNSISLQKYLFIPIFINERYLVNCILRLFSQLPVQFLLFSESLLHNCKTKPCRNYVCYCTSLKFSIVKYDFRKYLDDFFKKFVTHVQTRYDYMYFVHLNLKKIIVDFFKSLYLDSALSVNAIKFDKNIFISLDVHVPVTCRFYQAICFQQKLVWMSQISSTEHKCRHA